MVWVKWPLAAGDIQAADPPIPITVSAGGIADHWSLMVTDAHSYLEPLCPFSAKMARSLAANVVPQITKGGKYEGQVQLIVRIYAQPL